MAAVAVMWFLVAPRSAPGPSEEQLVKERRLRRELERALEEMEIAKSKWDAEKAAETIRRTEEPLKQIEQELDIANADLREFPVPDYLSKSAAVGQIRIAVTGASGVGKSSWINAVRRLRTRDPGAAPTGLTECTQKPQMYTFRAASAGLLRRALGKVVRGGRALSRALLPWRKRSEESEPEAEPIHVGDQVILRGPVDDGLTGKVGEVVSSRGSDSWTVRLEDGASVSVRRNRITGFLPECVLWDLPGVGTPKFPQATYVKSMGIRHFDMVVLMTATRFTEAELLLLEELKRWKVPYFLVRNKADVDVQSEIEKEEEEIESGELDAEGRKEVERRTIKSMKDFYKSEYGVEPVYCISTKRKLIDQFDFVQLERDIDESLKAQRVVQGEEAMVLARELGGSEGQPDEAPEAELEEGEDANEAAPLDAEAVGARLAQVQAERAAATERRRLADVKAAEARQRAEAAAIVAAEKRAQLEPSSAETVRFDQGRENAPAAGPAEDAKRRFLEEMRAEASG